MYAGRICLAQRRHRIAFIVQGGHKPLLADHCRIVAHFNALGRHVNLHRRYAR